MDGQCSLLLALEITGCLWSVGDVTRRAEGDDSSAAASPGGTLKTSISPMSLSD